jgi:hypothetical protein
VADQASVKGGGPVVNPGTTGTILSTTFTASKAEKLFVMATVNATPQSGSVSQFVCWASVDGAVGGAQAQSSHTAMAYENLAWGDSWAVTAGNHTVAIVCNVNAAGTASWNTNQPASVIAWGVG